jgi:hypothetical protein
MKKTLRLALAVAALAVATTASAQQRPTLGLGISIVPLEVSGLTPTVEVYLPIQVAPQFRIEPSLGIFTSDEDGGAETSDLTLGVGAFFVKRIAAPADMYMGARLKLNFASVDTGVADDSDTDLVLAAAVGGEYYLVPQFSLGLEAQLGLYQLGDVSAAAFDTDSGFFTTGLAFLRLYF